MSNNHLLTITAYALLVKRPGSTIRLMCRDGRLGAVKIGTEWLVDMSSAKTKNVSFARRGRPCKTLIGLKEWDDKPKKKRVRKPKVSKE